MATYKVFWRGNPLLKSGTGQFYQAEQTLHQSKPLSQQQTAQTLRGEAELNGGITVGQRASTFAAPNGEPFHLLPVTGSITLGIPKLRGSSANSLSGTSSPQACSSTVQLSRTSLTQQAGAGFVQKRQPKQELGLSLNHTLGERLAEGAGRSIGQDCGLAGGMVASQRNRSARRQGHPVPGR